MPESLARLPALLEVSDRNSSSYQDAKSAKIGIDAIFLESFTPDVFIGVPVRTRLDSRLKHAGMTDFG